MGSKDTILKQKFESIFKEHFTGLCYFAQKYLGDLDSSKEIVHSVFIKIWENRNSFEWDKPAKSYLFTAVYNRSMNAIRDRKKFVDSEDEEIHSHKLEISEFSDTMEVAELEAEIKTAIKKLPEKCREVFELNRFEGKKYAEIAEHLGISVKTVESQMSKALKIMKEELKDYIYLFLLGVFLHSMFLFPPKNLNLKDNPVAMIKNHENSYSGQMIYFTKNHYSNQGNTPFVCVIHERT